MFQGLGFSGAVDSLYMFPPLPLIIDRRCEPLAKCLESRSRQMKGWHFLLGQGVILQGFLIHVPEGTRFSL